jgi:IS605 OrfB family transposase
MALKSFQAKVQCETPEQRQYLELTHRLFCEHLAPVVKILYGAIRGRQGPEFQRILRTITGSQQAHGQIEAITSLASKPGSGGKCGWKDLARLLLGEQRILFDRDKLLPGLSSEFRRKVFDTAFQIILGHRAKLAAWRQEHVEWRKRKAEWEANHPEYLAVRPIILAFSEAEGKVAKRRGRWHRWLDFLASHPELAAWRGGPATVESLTPEEWSKVKQKRRRAVAEAFSIFFSKNPELKELDETHGSYERDFVRPWAKRHHHDGFKHAPTLTLPSVRKHPAWFSFKSDSTYRGLDLAEATIELKVIQAEDVENRSPRGFVAYRFFADARLRRFRKLSATVKSGLETCDLAYHALDGLSPRPAKVKGIKLVFNHGQPYLYFTVFVQDAPSRLTIAQDRIDKYGHRWTLTKVQEAQREGPIRTMAIDLGIRHTAAATVMEDDKLLGSRFIHHRPVLFSTGKQVTGIATLDQIAARKRALRDRLRKRGRPVEGEESCRRLSRHIRQMSEDRFKKSATAIVDFARSRGVHLIVMEKLDTLVPDAERERGINRALVNWNRGQLARWVKMLGEEYGLRIVEVPPFWTSRICHRCNHLGQRYSLENGIMTPGPVGKLFGCPACGYRCNADFNASVNLHRVFWGTFPKVQTSKGKKGYVEWSGQQVSLEQVRTAWGEKYLELTTPF